MLSEERPCPERLLADARQRQSECLGTLLELYRNYLLLLARTQIDLHLQGRVDASDLVQETFLDACRDFSQFRGQSERELLGWLRQILVCNVARAVQKQIGAQKRDARREISIERQLADLERSSARVEAALVSPLSSPSMQAQRRERIALIADHLARLPNDYREVIVLRNLESLPFAEVARRMGRTSGAVRVLWVRALDQFRQLLEEEGLR
jgi:RNA polymerase sigma-70 factor (ECF subfamily)